MMKRLILALCLMGSPVLADEGLVRDVVDQHILPRFAALASTSSDLSQAAQEDCTPASNSLRAAYNAAFDAWIAASHLRFGPTEADDRAFALAFWPDSRGATPRALSGLLDDEDPIAGNAAAYADVSIAARGFYALEFLLYDAALMQTGDAAYHCQLVQVIAADIALTSGAILTDWQNSYRDQILNPSVDGRYRTTDEAAQELFKALTTGLQFTSETRLGRPLGSFDRPRPTRAEARRSGRSARHVELSLTALRDLALRLAGGEEVLVEELAAEFGTVLARLEALDDPAFAGVASPVSRLKVEVIQQSIEDIREQVAQDLGPLLGVSAGFNALDGD